MLNLTEQRSADAVTVTTEAESEALDVFGAPMIVRSGGSANGLFVAEHTAPPGYAVPPHLHESDDEYFFILEGTLTLWSEAGEREVGPGALVTLPRAVRHGFRNAGDAPARFLLIGRPGVQVAELFRHLDRAGRAAPGGLAPPDIVAICAQYGVQM